MATSGTTLPSWYRRRRDGSLQYDGERPGADWHAHGYFSKTTLFIAAGRVVLLVVHKRRWREVGTNTTRHSRPPDDLPYMSVSTQLVALFLARCLGLELTAQPDIEARRSDRTVRRWLARALLHAMEVQQAIRHELIERCEPRPVESLFEGGLSPPQANLQQRRNQPAVWRLRTGLEMLLLASSKLVHPLQSLLAGARGRWNGPTDSFPI